MSRSGKSQTNKSHTNKSRKAGNTRRQRTRRQRGGFSPFSFLKSRKTVQPEPEISTMNIVKYIDELKNIVDNLNSSTTYEPVLPICEKIVKELKYLSRNNELTETVSNYVISRINNIITKLKGYWMYIDDRDELIKFLNTHIIEFIQYRRALYNPNTNLNSLGNMYAQRALERNAKDNAPYYPGELTMANNPLFKAR